MTTYNTAMAATLAAAVALAGAAWAEGELNIYNWGNYTSPELIEKFEKEFDVKVKLDGYDSNEIMLAKVKEGNTGYDIVVPSDSTAAIMVEQGLLAEVKPNEMENFTNMDPKWVDVYWDPGRNYTVPWQWGTTAFTVDTEVYDGDINTLELMFEPPEVLTGPHQHAQRHARGHQRRPALSGLSTAATATRRSCAK